MIFKQAILQDPCWFEEILGATMFETCEKARRLTEHGENEYFKYGYVKNHPGFSRKSAL